MCNYSSMATKLNYQGSLLNIGQLNFHAKKQTLIELDVYRTSFLMWKCKQSQQRNDPLKKNPSFIKFLLGKKIPQPEE